MNQFAIPRRSFLGGTMSLLAMGGAARAQEWPSRPITILVGFGAGGITDVATRLLAEQLRRALPKPVIVENRAGATGMIAAGQVARGQADGHLLFGMTGSLTIVPSVMKQVQIDVLKDLQPVSIYASSASLLVVNQAFPARTLAEFLDLARSKPPKTFAYASSGIGTTVHFMGGMIEQAAKIELLHVPYRSSADSISAAISGQVPIVLSAVNSALPHIQAGTVHALAVATEKRTKFLPDVPTFDEAGLPGIRSDTWFGLAAPAGTPRAIIDKLASLCDKAVREPSVLEKLDLLGAETVALGPDAARQQMQREVKSFAQLATALGIQPE